ncbi:MAG: TldD/PmbA family protein [Myxococcales bacterium]|nr:TldD/PmbA family protein [Myxococcales bacterium]MDD9971013.1 TldD/PmbA family protein [Myxococcales bacterium]
MSDYNIDELIALGQRIIEQAKKAGVDVAEAVVSEGAHLSAKVRLGEPELVEEAGSRSVGLRVMCGQQVAVTYTSDLSDAGLTRFIEDALELARLSQPDAFAGPPDQDLLSVRQDHPDLDLFDSEVNAIDAKRALEMAKLAERAALKSDKRLVNSEGATVSRQSGASALVTSGGFAGGNFGTYASIYVNPVADDTDGKKRSGSYWSARRHLSELEDPEAVGVEAARRTLAKLGARKLATQQVPVIFDPDAGRSMLSLLAGCITGGAVWRKASYLADREGSTIASELVTVVDDPLLPRGPGSRPFDGEGLLSRRHVVVDRGQLKTFLLDSYSARKLGRASTANASRGSGGGVSASTTNFVLQAGDVDPEALISSTDRALYVTNMMGYGFTGITGDFSRGASGFWIEGGERAFPVEEVTISENLDQILKGIDRIANDEDLRTSTCTPTFRVSRMTVAGG